MAAESIGISIASKVVELLVEPIVRQFRYMCCFNTFVEGLKEEEDKLERKKKEVQSSVNEAKRKTEEIETYVEAWLKDTEKAIEDVQNLKRDIEEDKHCFSKLCTNCIQQYQLSRRVAKEATKLLNLKERGEFKKISYQIAPTAIEFLPNKSFMPSLSTKSALEKIMEALKDDNVSIIGLHGMGGVGKTTLVKEVGMHATELKMFDMVLLAVVSKTLDLINIQGQIAEKLGFELKENTKDGRASRLWQRLESEKKLLVILDDLWEDLDLKEIGIPFDKDHMKCKILLTTRLQHVCTSMGCQRVVELHVLSPSEAWTLFKVNAGLLAESLLTNVAMEVAKECKGLPIAIVTVGRALKGKSSDAWDAAVKRLKRSELLKLEDVHTDKNAYTCLKLSFDHLSRWETKLCFLLCSLFPEDYEIAIEDLVRHAIGFGLYEDMDSIEEARKEVHAAVEKLIASCLLIGTEGGGHVKMHDMVRDVALWISKVGNVFEDCQWRTYKAISVTRQEEWPRTGDFQDCTSISLLENKISEVPDDLVYPKLKMLLLRRSLFRTYEDFIHVSNVSFNGMKELKVLCLEGGLLSKKSLASLTNLQTLELKYCRINYPTSEGNGIDDFSSLQMLKSLKILSFRQSSFKELPRELGELNNLKLLDLRDCCFKSIPSNTIKRLPKLEELYINQFSIWLNDSLMELCSLAHLTVLWLKVRQRIPGDFAFPSLTSYVVHVNCEHTADTRIRYPTTRSICCGLSKFNITRMRKLFFNAYDLVLTDNDPIFKSIIPDVDPSGWNNLIQLGLEFCRMKCLITTKQQRGPLKAFSNLEEISMHQTHVEEFCDGQPPEGFLKNLKTVTMYRCSVPTVFPAKLWQALQNLEAVRIQYSDIKLVFQFDEANEASKRLLSNLRLLEISARAMEHIWKGPTHDVNLKSLTTLTLFNCSSLTFIFSFPLARTLVHLQTLSIEKCGNLKHIISEDNEEENEIVNSEAHSQSHGLQNLKTVDIHQCDSLEYIFPISFAGYLPHLEVISIQLSDQIRHFFGNGKHSKEDGYFFSGNASVIFPSLQSLFVFKCPELSMHSVDKIKPPTKTLEILEEANGGIAEGSQLKSIEIYNCGTLEYIISKENDVEESRSSLKSPVNSSFYNDLQRIEVVNCQSLKCLFPVTFLQELPQLEYLKVKKIDILMEVFEHEGISDNERKKEIVVPKLLELHLRRLPRLIRLCSGFYHFTFPSLRRLHVNYCPELITRFSITEPIHSVDAVTQEPEIVRQQTLSGSVSTQSVVRTTIKNINWVRQRDKNCIYYNEKPARKEEEEDSEDDEEEQSCDYQEEEEEESDDDEEEQRGDDQEEEEE